MRSHGTGKPEVLTARTDIVVVVDGALWRRLLGNLLVAGIQVGIIGIGVWVNSTAMQWAGFLAVVLVVWAWAKARPARTPQEAADHLREKYGAVAEEP